MSALRVQVFFMYLIGEGALAVASFGLSGHTLACARATAESTPAPVGPCLVYLRLGGGQNQEWHSYQPACIGNGGRHCGAKAGSVFFGQGKEAGDRGKEVDAQKYTSIACSIGSCIKS